VVPYGYGETIDQTGDASRDTRPPCDQPIGFGAQRHPKNRWPGQTNFLNAADWIINDHLSNRHAPDPTVHAGARRDSIHFDHSARP
jgi:hypothetical protein